MTASARKLFESLRPRIRELAPNVLELAEAKSVSYHAPGFFLEVLPRKQRLILLLPVDHSEITDPTGLAQDATEWKFFFYAKYEGGVWCTFIDAAEEYLQAAGLEEYPDGSDRCIYCRQPFTDAASQLIRKYRDFCNDAFKKAVQDALRTVESLTAPIRTLDIKTLSDWAHTLAIDAKAWLYESYLAAQDISSDEQRQKAHQEFVQKLRGRVQELAGRGYQKYVSEAVPYVVMFVPSEAAERNDPR